MTRIADGQLVRGILNDVLNNHRQVIALGEQVSSGNKVSLPGDSDRAASINDYRTVLQKIAGYTTRINTAKSYLTFQEDVVAQAVDITTQAKELATQAASGSQSQETRAQSAKQVFQLRDQLVALANSQYQGKYIYSGTNDSNPAYAAAAYTNPAATTPVDPASQRYVYDTAGGNNNGTNTYQIADNVSITVNTPGNTVFDTAIQALERLGRALSGYATNPASGAPDGTGAAFTFPTDATAQLDAIRSTIDQLDSARENDLLPERVSIGARLKRLETSSTLLDSNKATTQQSLSDLQDADSATTIAQFQQAQYALQASLQINSSVLKMTILDYL